MSAAQAGVEPNTVTGEAWILPYKDHGTLRAQFQLGAKGYARLAQRDGTVVLPPQTVYENDEFHYQLGSDPKLEHIPALKDRGEPIGYYAVWKNAKYESEGFYFMSKEDVEKHAKRYSKSYNSSFSPWQTAFSSMAEKTVVKRALKFAPMSVETAALIAGDETIKSDISADMSVVPDEVDYAEVVETDAETGEVKNEREES
jgi:recombination protein RecT